MGKPAMSFSYQHNAYLLLEAQVGAELVMGVTLLSVD
jgi:hypothetical protein